jgi:DNA invertase Pin-like site-specific DNA recombinase
MRFDRRTGHDGARHRSEDGGVRANLPGGGHRGRWNRPELQRLLDHFHKGDILVVWKLDLLSRSLRDELTIMERIQEAKGGFRSLTEAIDTTTRAGRMMMLMMRFADRSSIGEEHQFARMVDVARWATANASR